MKFLASSAFGLEGVLKNELVLLGMDILETQMGSVVFKAPLDSLIWTNSSLRTSDRVYWILDEFKAYSFDELYDSLIKYPFEDLMPTNAKIIINAKSFKSKLYSLRDIQKIGKKAIVDRFFRKKGIRYMDETGKSYPFLIKIDRDKVYLLLDTSGEALHKRGYRLDTRLAPIRENFAASLILLSRWFGKGIFHDPLCGSGTIPIEAALIARNIAPGLNRKFLFESWNILDKNYIRNEREKMKSNIKTDIDVEIRGSDIDKTAIVFSKRNAKKARVKDDINFNVKDISLFETEFTGGTIVTNMPYAVRISTNEEIEKLEKVIEDRLLSLETYRIGILSGNDKFSRNKKRRANKVRKFYNGKIETFFYQYEATKRW